MDFTHAHTACFGRSRGAAAGQKRARVKHEALRECERTLDVRAGETEDDAEREQRLSRMRDYARSRREAEDGVHIHVVHAWPSGCKRPFTDRVVFC